MHRTVTQLPQWCHELSKKSTKFSQFKRSVLFHYFGHWKLKTTPEMYVTHCQLSTGSQQLDYLLFFNFSHLQKCHRGATELPQSMAHLCHFFNAGAPIQINIVGGLYPTTPRINLTKINVGTTLKWGREKIMIKNFFFKGGEKKSERKESRTTRNRT